MTMALRADIFEKCMETGEKRPVDLVYLSSQTMGDEALEAEILAMFAAQLPGYILGVCEASNIEEIQQASHTLKGAARSVGAFELANLAAEIETSHRVDGTALQRALSDILNFIETLT